MKLFVTIYFFLRTTSEFEYFCKTFKIRQLDKP